MSPRYQIICLRADDKGATDTRSLLKAAVGTTGLALVLHRREPWRRRCARGRVRNDKRVRILTKEDSLFHLGKTGQECESEKTVGLHGEESTDEGEGFKIDTSEHGVAVYVEKSRCSRQHGVD